MQEKNEAINKKLSEIRDLESMKEKLLAQMDELKNRLREAQKRVQELQEKMGRLAATSSTSLKDFEEEKLRREHEVYIIMNEISFVEKELFYIEERLMKAKDELKKLEK